MLPHTQFQHTRVEELCQNNVFTREQKFPTDDDRLTDFHSHLLFDDEKNITFYCVPKVSVCGGGVSVGVYVWRCFSSMVNNLGNTVLNNNYFGECF